MDKNLEKYYETMFDLFNHPGWGLFMDDVSLVQRSVQDNILKGIHSGNSLERSIGSNRELQYILDTEDRINKGYETLKLQEEWINND